MFWGWSAYDLLYNQNSGMDHFRLHDMYHHFCALHGFWYQSVKKLVILYQDGDPQIQTSITVIPQVSVFVLTPTILDSLAWKMIWYWHSSPKHTTYQFLKTKLDSGIWILTFWSIKHTMEHLLLLDPNSWLATTDFSPKAWHENIEFSSPKKWFDIDVDNQTNLQSATTLWMIPYWKRLHEELVSLNCTCS